MAGKSPPVIPSAAPDEKVAAPESPPTTDYIPSVSRSKTDSQPTCEATPMNAGDALSPDEKIHQPDQLMKKTTSKRPQRTSVGDYVNKDDLSLSAPPCTDRGRFYIGAKQDHDLEKTNYEDANVEGEDEDASSFLEGEAEDQAIGELVKNVIDKVKTDLMNERANLRALERSTTEPSSTAKPTFDKTVPEAISYAEKELPSKESIKTIGHHQKEVEKLAETSDTENLYEGDEEKRFLNKEEEDEIGALINSVLTRAESDVLRERNGVPHYDSEKFGDEVDSPDDRLTSVERNLLDEVSTSSKDGNSQTEVLVEDTRGEETLSGGDSDLIGDEEKLGLSRDMQNDQQIEASDPEEKDMHKIPQRRAGDKVAAKAELEKNKASAQNTDELEAQRTGVEKHEKRVHGGALSFVDGGDENDEVTTDADEEEELNSMIGSIIDSARSSLLVKSVDISTASSEESRNVSNDKEIESIKEAEENETFSTETAGNSLDPLRIIQNGVTVEGNHDDANELRKASGNTTLNDSGGDNPKEEQDEADAILQPVVGDVKAECQSSLPGSDVEPPETDTDDKVSSVAKEIMDKIISILTSRTLSDDANVPPATPAKVNGSTDQQSQRVSDTLPCKPTADSPQQNPTSPRHNTTASVIGQQVPLTADDIASDSDSDDDVAAVSVSETKSSGVDENDWECLAIRQISKSQSTLAHYGDTYHNWYPAYNTAHLGVTDLLKKYKEDACDRVERKLDKMAAKRNKADTVSSKPDLKIPQKGKEDNKHLPINHTESTSTKSQHEVKLTPAMLPLEPGPDREAVESGMALINDRLRKKIVALDQQIKNLALNLTFLGDRNWRLEAYIDCLIKTLEVLEVTDVVDLDQKTLPLCLFRVKVKAGYKLSSYNGIPSRSLWSYAKDGRKPPFVDLSGWGDRDKPAESTLDPSFTPTPADDVGLSATQMYEYESQIEELSMQNQVLEAQLREANERAEASVTGGDTAEPGLQNLHQQQQHTDQPQYIQQDALQRQFLQQQLQQLQEYHHDQWREINQQLEQQQQLQQQQMEQQQVLTVDPSSQPQQQEQQYSVSKIPQQPPQQQQQQQLPHHDQLQQQQQLQQHQSYQFQQYQPPMLQQQQQLQYQPPALQQTWLPKAVQDDVVISATSDWKPSGHHGLQDPQDWPTLTESQATVDAKSFSNSETVTEGSSHSVPARRHKPLASGTVSDITQPKVTSSPNDKSTLYSSLSLPASTGSIPNNEDRHKVPQDNKPKARAQSSSSAQSINRGRRFETNYRREPPRSSPSPHLSRSGIETVPRPPRQESFRRHDDGWNSSRPPYPGYHDAANRRHHPDNWHPERPAYRNNWHGPSYDHHQRNGQRNPNYDSTQHLLRLAESGLESVFGTDHVLFFKNQMQQEGSRFNDRDFENGRHSSPQRTHEYNGSSTGSGNHGYPSHGRLYGRRPTTPTRRGDGAWNGGPHRTFRPTATDEPRNE